MLDITHAPVCRCCDLNKNKKYFNALFPVGRTVCEGLEGVAFCWRRCVTMGVTLNFQKSIPFQIISLYVFSSLRVSQEMNSYLLIQCNTSLTHRIMKLLDSHSESVSFK